MTEVIQIDGAPGTGKTHSLKQKLREEKRNGVGVSDFWWLTFTNAGRKDVEPELGELFPKSDDAADRARTFHSLSLSLAVRNGILDPTEVRDVIISPNDKSAQEHYKAFCNQHGMRFDESYADPRKLLAGEKSTEYTGNLLFAINQYLTQTCKPPEKYRSAPVEIPIPGERVQTLLEAWDEYKRNQDTRLFEHGDYVAEVYERGLTPGVGVLLVDEFQDLAPLEYRLYKLWRDSGQLDRIYIAGDPNQSIYSFRGGTPYYFEETAIDNHIDLKTSWRCPRQIAFVGNAVLDTHDNTDARGFSGREPGGRVEWWPMHSKHELRNQVISATENYPDSEPSVLLLTRTRRQRYRLLSDLKDAGIPFGVLGTVGGVWQDDLPQLLTFLNNLRNNAQAFAWPNVSKTLSYLSDGDERRQQADTGLGGICEREDIAPALDGFTDVLDIVERLELERWKRDILKNAVDAPGAIEAGDVQVGTIHAAKGLEAPCVYLFGDSTENTVRRYARNDDFASEEHRVYYVGATRASAELYLVDGYFGGPTAPPLEKVRQQKTVIA